MANFIMALDQGTTSCRAILFDKEGHMIGSSSKEFQQIYPQPGWVEHDRRKYGNVNWRLCAGFLRKTIQPLKKLLPLALQTKGRL